MGYALIPLVVSVVLALHHMALPEASPRSKAGVVAVVAASLLIWRYLPRWSVLATLLQVGAGIYLLVYLKLRAR